MRNHTPPERIARHLIAPRVWRDSTQRQAVEELEQPSGFQIPVPMRVDFQAALGRSVCWQWIQSGGLILVRYARLHCSARIVGSRGHGIRSIGPTAATRTLLLESSSVWLTTVGLASAAVTTPHSKQRAAATGTGHEEEDTADESCETFHDRTFSERGMFRGEGANSSRRSSRNREGTQGEWGLEIQNGFQGGQEKHTERCFRGETGFE